MKDDKRKGETKFFFNGKSKNYHTRPDFDKRCFCCLKEEYGLSRKSVVAELGAGTGKFTKKVSALCGKIYAVEPNDEMFSVGKKVCGCKKNVEYVHATAEETTLKDQSLDMALAVQSFHYFDKQKLLLELRRILKPNGKFAIIWNINGNSNLGFDAEWSELLIAQKKELTGSGDNHNLLDERKVIFKNGEFEEKQFSRDVKFSYKKLCKYASSISFVPKQNDAGFEEFYGSLLQIFKKHKRFGKVKINVTTNLQIGEINQEDKLRNKG